jgi:hypothetical protein
MDPYIVFLACLGLIILAVSWLPLLLRDLPLSLPILCVLFGFVVFSLPGVRNAVDPLERPLIIERLANWWSSSRCSAPAEGRPQDWLAALGNDVATTGHSHA